MIYQIHSTDLLIAEKPREADSLSIQRRMILWS